MWPLLLAIWFFGFTVGWAGRDWLMKSVEDKNKENE